MNKNIPIVEIKKVIPPLKNMPKIAEDDLKIEEIIIKLTETDEGETIAIHIEKLNNL
mgnify:CR=1 FL=1|jgi:hypothetical protein|tara:strand:- start:9170 stop:9340 length:171 start_codon:yes stop_codon:yes gene_type:complete